MKILLLLSIILISINLVCIRFFRLNYIDNPVLLTRESTSFCKGYGSLLIVLCHLGTHMGDNLPLNGYLMGLGYPVVGLFFFLSGFGLMKSFLAKGDSYLVSFGRKRLLKTMIPFLWASIISLMVDYFRGENVLDLLSGFAHGITPLPNSWYVYAIMLYYLLFWMVFKHVKKRIDGLVVLSILIFVYCAIIRFIHWGDYWRASSLCFIIGLFFAHYYDIINKYVTQYLTIVLYLLLSISIVFLAAFMYNNYFETDNNLVGFLTLHYLPIALSISISLFSPLVLTRINFLKSVFFELYLIHGVVLSLAPKGYSIISAILVSIILIFISVLCAFILKKLGDITYKQLSVLTISHNKL